MTRAILQSKFCGQSAFVGGIVFQNFLIVLCSHGEVAAELPLIACQEAELGIRNGRIAAPAVVLKIVVADFEAEQAGAATLNYGLFLNHVINFLIVAFAVFLLVRQVNRLKRGEPAPPAPTTKDCPYCYSAISIRATRCGHCTSELKAT